MASAKIADDSTPNLTCRFRLQEPSLASILATLKWW
jgi:hypothetical protein